MHEIKDCWCSTEAQNRQSTQNSILSRHGRGEWAEGGSVAKSSVLPLDAT